MFFEPIETERLYLKNISSDDRDFILKEFSDAAVNEFLFDAEPMTCLEDADEIIGFYTQPEPRSQHRWIITLKDGGEKIGTCGFHCHDTERHCAEVGYDLQPEYWRRGIMTEAMGAVLSLYVPKMELYGVNAHIYKDNAASLKLAEKLGFIDSGATVNYSFRGDDYIHTVMTLIAK